MATKARPTRPAPAPAAPVVEPHPVELWLCQAAVVIAGLLFLRGTRETFNLGRMTFLALVGVGLAGILATSLRRPQQGRPSAKAVVVGVFTAAVLVAWAISRTPSAGFFGPYARQTGAALYLTGIALFLAMARQRGELAVRSLLGAVAVSGGLAAAYGTLQAVGADPFDWPGATLGKVFSTFGQVNFAAGYVGIVAPVLVYFALRVDVHPVLRWAAGLGALATAVVAVESRSFQGLVALAVGLLPIALYLLKPGYERLPRQRRALGVAAVVAVVVVVGALGAGFLHEQLSSGFRERIYFWRAALDMFKSRPIFGRGFGAFVDEFFRHRPAGHAEHYGLNGADAPHSVPLEMLVNGGIVLFAAYVAFVVWVALSLWRAFRTRGGLLVAAVGGAWLAYQVQSLVSLDVPPLLVLHFVLAGAVVALSRPEPAARRRGERAPAFDWVPVVVGAVLAGVLLLPLTGPLRADALAHRGEERITSGKDVPGGLADLHHAYETNPVGVYAAEEATQLLAQGHVGDALAAGKRAVAASPGALQYLVTLGKLELQLGHLAEARASFARALRDNPHDAAMVGDIGRAYFDKGLRKAAERWYKRSLAIQPTSGGWAALAELYEQTYRPELGAEARVKAQQTSP